MLMEPLLPCPAPLTTTPAVRRAPGCCCRLLTCLRRWLGAGRHRWGAQGVACRPLVLATGVAVMPMWAATILNNRAVIIAIVGVGSGAECRAPQLSN